MTLLQKIIVDNAFRHDEKKITQEDSNFTGDAEIAAFMEKHSAFDLIDAGLAEVVATPSFVCMRETGPKLLKDQRVQVAFRDERALKKIFSSRISSARVFFVIDADTSGILLGLPDAPVADFFYVPYLNIGGVKVLKAPQA